MSEQAVDNAATGKSEAEIQQKASFADAARIVALQMSKRLGGQPRDLDFIKLRSPPSQILERLYLGDLFHAQDKELLKNLQITHVVSVLEWAPSFSHDLALRKLHIRLRDSGLEDILKHLDRTTEFIRDALKDSSSVVLVHCFQGISRSATVVAAYLLATSKFHGVADVLAFIREKRSIISPNFGFLCQLEEYAKRYKVNGSSAD